MSTPTAELLKSPKLPQYVEELKHALAAEKGRRLRFYRDTPEGQKAEFINGEVIVNPPARNEHLASQELLFSLLSFYVRARDLGRVAGEKTMIALTRNDYEPDICFFAKAKARLFKRGQTRFPAPDFVVEILSPSTASIDRGVKFEDYAAHGVAEYWLVDPAKRALEQYVLEAGEYRLAFKGATGTVRSRVVKGFAIPVRAIFDSRVNLETLRKLIG
jgi:Uma2 family endonuclease